jgi:hypothetical protein
MLLVNAVTEGRHLPPASFAFPSRMVRRSTASEWRQACAVPLSGGGGYFPSSPVFCHSSTTPWARTPWQLAQCSWNTVRPRSTCSDEYQRSAAIAGVRPANGSPNMLRTTVRVANRTGCALYIYANIFYLT